MGTAKPPSGWDLGRQLLDKSLELAYRDPEMAVRLANLGVRAAALIAKGYDPFAPKVKRKPRRRRKKRTPDAS